MTATESLVVQGATVRCAPGEPPLRADVLVGDGRILRVGTELGVPTGGTVVDGAGGTLMAGFWNSHVHLTGPQWARAGRRPVDELEASLADMLTSHGFTTVADLASDPRATLPLVRRVNAGEVVGPRIHTAGLGIHPERGLPFYTKESTPWFFWWAIPTPWTSVGARFTVRRQLRAGADLVKLFTGSYVTPKRIRPMRLSIARAAVEVAHEKGVLVFAHTSNRVGLQVALDAGVDVVAHVPDETDGVKPLLQRAADKGVVLVPTLQMFARTVTESRSYLDPIWQALRDFRAAGGRVMFGTDVGYMPDSTIDFEVAALAECGMDADAILACLTTTPAEVFGASDTGRVAPGLDGDLVLVDGDPWADIGAFAAVRTTIRGGRVIWSRAAGRAL